MGDEAFEDDVGTEAFDEVDDKVDVFLRREEVKVSEICKILFRHPSALDELQLMEFEQRDGKRREDFRFVKKGIPTLPWQAENEVCAHTDATSSGACDGIDGLSVGVPTIDAQKRGIIDGFNAVFDNEEGATIQLLQIVEQGIRHTVGTGADDDADDIRNGKRLLVFGFKTIESVVGVGVGLKVSQILHVGVFAGKELLAFLELLGDGLFRDAIVRIERLVVAIGATACAHPTVAIGAGEASVERDFLGLHTQLLLQPKTIFVVYSHCTKTRSCVQS